MDTLTDPSLSRAWKVSPLLKVFFFFFLSNKISLFKTLAVLQLRVDLESLQQLELTLASDLQSTRYYLVSAICSHPGKGISYGRTEHAPELSVTYNDFNIFNSQVVQSSKKNYLAADAAEHLILINASARDFLNKKYKEMKLGKNINYIYFKLTVG